MLVSRNFFQEVTGVSPGFCIILNEQLEVEEILSKDKSIKAKLNNDHLMIEQNGQLNAFIKSIEEFPNELTKQQVILNLNDERWNIQCIGEKAGKNIIIFCSRLSEGYLGLELLEKLPLPAMLINNYGNIIKYNSKLLALHKLLGINFNANLTLKKNNFPSGSIFQAYYKIYKQLILSKEDVTMEYYQDNIRLSLHAIVDGENSLIIMKDESLKVRYEQLLSYQQQMKAFSQVAAGVAHELRNPLSVIKGFIQLSKIYGTVDKYYETIFSEIEQMNNVIEDFLSISRKKIDKRYYQPSEMIESLLMIFRSECILHDVEFFYNVEQTEGYLYVNEQMIKQVLINILRNSIEAYEGQKDNRRFQLITSVEDQRFYIIVLEDRGPGIPNEVLKKIDQPFFTTKETGTGIGIPLGKQIVEEHKGDFNIESEYGSGTTVTIKLPLYKDKW